MNQKLAIKTETVTFERVVCLCPVCQSGIQWDFKFCPYCSQELEPLLGDPDNE